MSNRRGMGVKHYCNVQSGGERLKASPEVFTDCVRFPHATRLGFGSLDWHNFKLGFKGGEPYPISWEFLLLVWSVPLVRRV